MRDAIAFAIGTLTALPFPAPKRLDTLCAGRAMVLAPLVGGALALAPTVVIVLADGRGSALLMALLALALLALLTRGLHWDGLADTADGLGSAKGGQLDAARALEIMRRGDIGAFGAMTLIVVVGLQATALGQLIDSGKGGVAMVAALMVSRFVLPILCLRGVRAARAEGLGSIVVSSVSPPGPLLALLGLILVLPFFSTLVASHPHQHLLGWSAVIAGSMFGLAVGLAFALHCVRKLGGITGDVLGASVELTMTGALVAFAFTV